MHPSERSAYAPDAVLARAHSRGGRGHGRGARIAPEPPEAAAGDQHRAGVNQPADGAAAAAVAAELGRQAVQEVFAAVARGTRPPPARRDPRPLSPSRAAQHSQHSKLQPAPDAPVEEQQQQQELEALPSQRAEEDEAGQQVLSAGAAAFPDDRRPWLPLSPAEGQSSGGPGKLQEAAAAAPPPPPQAEEQSREGGGWRTGAAPLDDPSDDRPRSAPTTSRPSMRAAMPPQSLYERLKTLRPADQREELEEQEAYWQGDDDMQERRIQLQRRQQDEQMLERIKRRVAGEKMEVPRVLQRLKSTFGTPRSEGADSGRSQQSTSASGSARRLLASGVQLGSARPQTGVTKEAVGGSGDAVAVSGRLSACTSSWWPKVQHAAEQFTSHPDFQLVVLLIILFNCADIAINVLFTVELVLMMAAAGGPIEYLRGPWNVFDFLMVLAGYTTFIPAVTSSSASGTAAVRALRALRALRLLRTITRFESLRSIVVCFLEAVPMLVSVVGLLYFNILLFAIAALVLFLDTSYFACIDATTGSMLEETLTLSGEMWGCGARGYQCPANMTCSECAMQSPLQTAGFGNIGLSLLSMFQVATITDWTYQLYLVMDRSGPFPIVFYVFYIFLQCYFVVNLFLAVLKHRFATATTLYSKVVADHGKPLSTLTLAWLALRARVRSLMDTQRSEFEERISQRSSRSASQRSPQASSRAGAASPGLLLGAAASGAAALDKDGPPVGVRAIVGYYWFECRWRVRQVVDHPAFTWIFMALIIANTVLLAMTTADMPAGYASALDIASQVLTGLFAAEVVLKLIDLGVSGFLCDLFNAFDLLVVALGLLEIVLMMGASGNSMRSFRTLRILCSFRVLRVLKIFRYLDSLRVIFEVMMGSMPQFLAVALLMVLFIFVFALIGLQVFGQQSTQFGPPLPSFLGFLNSFMLVFQVLTLENWPDTMYKVQAAAGWPSVLFFVAWVTIGKWIILTLFLAITLAAFEQSYATVTRTTTGGTLTRAITTLADLPQRLLLWFRCCCCRPRERLHQGQAPGVVGRAALWQQAVTVNPAAWPTEGSEEDVPPLLTDADAKKAGATWSAAMSAKLGAAAVDGSEAEDGSGDGGAAPGLPAADTAAAEPSQTEALIKAAPAASGPADAGAEAPGQPHLTRVGSMVQHFERLSSSKLGAHVEEQRLQGSTEGSQLSSALSESGAAAPGSKTARPKRTASERERFRAAGRHARFAGVPEDAEEENQAAPSAGSSSPPPANACSMRSPTPFPCSKLPGSSPLGSTSTGQWPNDNSRHTLPSSGQQPTKRQQGRLQRQGSDQQLAADLQDAQSESQCSGISGTSSVGSHFSRLSSHVRRRSRRKDYPPLRGTSLRFFKVDNPLRGLFYNLVTMQAVDYFLMLVVLLSCVEMAMETPSMDPAARKTQVLHWIDMATTAVFGMEALLKIVAFGFRPYISFNTNKLDLGVVAVWVVVLIAESANARFLKVLRVLRAVRPLRMLTRSQSMLMVFHTLVRSLAAMGNVTVLAGMVFLIFAILGVQLFAGLLWSCNDDGVAGKDDCVGVFLDPATGTMQPREWTNLWLNFDNVGNALLTLFITSTLDGYTPTMYLSMATSRAAAGLQPQEGSNPAAFLFWFAFITFCSFFVLNLFTGVVFMNYARLRSLSDTGSAVLTATQTGHVEMLRAVFRLKPLDVAPMPANRLRRWFYLTANNPWFDRFMLLTVVLNIVLTATTFYGAPSSFNRVQEIANTVFSALVIMELVVKLTAMGPRLYWRSNWNKLDVVLSLAALLDIVTQVVNAASGTDLQLGAFKRVMMLGRVLRMFRLLRHSKGIQMLLTTLIISLPAVANVGALLFLLFFVFAYMGVLLFGQVVWQENLNEHANFSTFPHALLVLLRVATGDNWAALLQECMVKPPICDLAASNCGHAWAPAYFFAFYLSGAMIALNLLVTVQLETFEKIQDTADWTLTPQHLEDFVELWAEYDDGSNSIDPKDMEGLLRRLPPPMGLGPRATDSDVLRFVYSLEIPLDDDGLVPFHRTAYELVMRCTQAEIPEGELKRRLDRMIRRFLNRHAPKTGEREHMNVQVALTVMRIQRQWRATAARRKAERLAARPVVPPLNLSNLRSSLR